ncbi:hypothetical protein [Sinorhizobium sp. BG8]|uniref:hypothetical protein n=1 Tax=Sinorhizobium sp. BG8 TaxID=2613773 RepID=UPI00193E6056|nr:hypothetical protein [Sinorhizobium sp. BG8]QRM57718.1 hypothetical protein F3Y30_24970 [Sinorhizobium sp. BG8]
MARSASEWGQLLGTTLDRMTLADQRLRPGTGLSPDCYRVITDTFAFALREARAAGYAEAMESLENQSPKKPLLRALS